MDAKILIESFAEFARSKNVDRPTMIRILEDVFRAMIRKKFESDENFDVTINADKGDLEIFRIREIVDDNSEDNSKIVLSNLKKKYKNIRFFIRKNKIRDLFQSCLLGIKNSKYQYNLIMDGDLQHNPRYIPKMLQKFISNKNISNPESFDIDE